MTGFIYLFKSKNYYQIGSSTNILDTILDVKPQEILNISRCSNYIQLAKEIRNDFINDKIINEDKYSFNDDQIESINLIIRAKSQY